MSHRERITNIKQSVYFPLLLPTFILQQIFTLRVRLNLIYTHIGAFGGDTTRQMLA